MPAATAWKIEAEFSTPSTVEQTIWFTNRIRLLVADDDSLERLPWRISNKAAPRPPGSTFLLDTLINQLFDELSEKVLVSIDVHEWRRLDLIYKVSNDVCSKVEQAVAKAIEQVQAET